MRRLLKKLFVFIVSLVLALGVLEVGVRALGIGPRGRAPMHDFDPQVGWRKKPGITVENLPDRGDEFRVTFTTNARGLRDDEIAEHKAQGERRILFVGDSFTLGYTVDRKDLFVDLVEKRLRDGGKNVQCINGGTEGYSTDQCALWFETAGRKLEPDLVLYVFYQNDLYWNLHDHYLQFVKPRFLPAADAGPDAPWGPANVPLVDNGATRPGFLDQFQVWRLFNRPRLPMTTLSLANGAVTLPEESCVSLKQLPDFAVQAYAATEGILRWLKARCADAGCRLGLVIIPDKAEVYTDDYQRMLAQNHLTERDWDRGRPTRELVRIGKRLELPIVLDATAGFARAASGSNRLYYEKDRHLSPEGNRALANQLYPLLK